MTRFPLLRLFTTIFLFSASSAAQISVLGGLSFDREARAGEKYEASFIIKNDSDQPQEARVYQKDYLFSCDGTNVYGDPGSLPRSNARWITFSPSYIVVPPRGTVTVNYAVSVPGDSGHSRLVGSYWSMLMVEAIPPGSAESSLRKRDSTAFGLFQVIRYGIQIATHLANTGMKSVKFIDAKLLKGEDGGRTLQVDLENNGDLFIRPEVSVELFDTSGASKGKIQGARFRMYPGTSVRQNIQLGGITPGTYKALVVVDAGGEDVFGAQYTLQF